MAPSGLLEMRLKLVLYLHELKRRKAKNQERDSNPGGLEIGVLVWPHLLSFHTHGQLQGAPHEAPHDHGVFAAWGAAG